MKWKSFIPVILCIAIAVLLCSCNTHTNKTIDITYKDQNDFWGKNIAKGNEAIYYVRKGSEDALIRKDLITGEEQKIASGKNIHSLSIADYLFFIEDNQICCYDENTNIKDICYKSDYDDSSILAVKNKVLLTSWKNSTDTQNITYDVSAKIFEYNQRQFNLIDSFTMPQYCEKKDAVINPYEYFPNFYRCYLIEDEVAEPYSYLYELFYLKDYDYCRPGAYRAIVNQNIIGFETDAGIYIYDGCYIYNYAAPDVRIIDFNNVCPSYQIRQFFEYRDNTYAIAFYKGKNIPDSTCLIKLNLDDSSAEKIVEFEDDAYIVGFANELLYGIKKDGTVFSYDISTGAKLEFYTIVGKNISSLELELSYNYLYVNKVRPGSTETELVKLQ